MPGEESVRVLYIEDDPGAGRLVQRKLQRAGYSVDLAPDGTAGLERWRTGAYHILAVNQKMKGMTGLEVIRALAAEGPLPPTVMIAGQGSEGVIVEAMKLGATDYVVKDSEARYLDLIPHLFERALKMYQALQRLHPEFTGTESALRESERKFATIFQTSPDAITITTLSDGTFLEVNDRFTQIMDYTIDELNGLSSQELGNYVNPEDRAKMVSTLREHGSVDQQEIQFRRKDGSTFWGSLSARPITLRGKPCVLSITRDISDRKRAEEQLKRSLEEKEVLLREIHHRVKNNLALISSLIALQSSYVTVEPAQEAFEVIQARVRSMALAHDMLYQSDNLAQLDVARYVENLVEELISSLAIGRTRVHVEKEIENVSLTLDTAIPLGFLLTELVSNCLKHAFPERETGLVRISFRASGENRFELIVSDNGVGLPEHLDIRNPRSLGFGLIRSYVTQLRGHIEVERKKGTMVKIDFTGATTDPG